MTEYRNPPDTFFGITKQLGPGLIISANIVGSGELIVTPSSALTLALHFFGSSFSAA
jgi:hypothetical protein